MNDSSMPRLAICLYGDDNSQLELVKSICIQRYSTFDITFFERIHQDKFKAMWLCSFDKDCYEFDTKLLFHICIAIDIEEHRLLDFTNIPYSIEDKVYYTSGFYKFKRHYAGASPCIFFANSILFSRACEFYLNNIPLDALVEDSLEVRFFFHLKSYNIITECINYENRSLFKRTASNS